MVKRNSAAGRLRFTTDAKEGVDHGQFQLIAVGTPPDEDGSADLRHVLAVARTIGEHMGEYKVVITKSTVPVGTADKVRAAVAASLKARGAERRVRHGLEPRIPEGGRRDRRLHEARPGDRRHRAAPAPRSSCGSLYEPFTRNHDRMIVMDVRSAGAHQVCGERHARDQNQLHERTGESGRALRRGHRVGARRHRLGPAHRSRLHLPRRGLRWIVLSEGRAGLEALGRRGRLPGEHPDARSRRSTSGRKTVLFDKIKAHFGDLRGKTIALWGLAFKPNTDDMREAPSRVLMEACGRQGPGCGPMTRWRCPNACGSTASARISCCARPAPRPSQGADALAIVTEWREFRSPDFDTSRARSRPPVIFDGRNLYDPRAHDARRASAIMQSAAAERPRDEAHHEHIDPGNLVRRRGDAAVAAVARNVSRSSCWRSPASAPCCRRRRCAWPASRVPAHPIIVCNEAHRFTVAEQLRTVAIRRGGILLEPVGRNTAPAVALAALQAHVKPDPEAILIDRAGRSRDARCAQRFSRRPGSPPALARRTASS